MGSGSVSINCPFQRSAGHNSSRSVSKRSASRLRIGRDRDVLFALIGNLEDVGQRRSSSTAHSASSPRARFPGNELAVLVGGDLHARKRRGTHAGDFLFGIALQHDLHRLATRLLGELCACDSPAVRRKLAAESAANILLHDLNVAGGNAERLRHLAHRPLRTAVWKLTAWRRSGRATKKSSSMSRPRICRASLPRSAAAQPASITPNGSTQRWTWDEVIWKESEAAKKKAAILRAASMRNRGSVQFPYFFKLRM